MTASRASERERRSPVDGGWRDATPRRPPYRGLESYTESEDDAALFFGRDSELEVAAANLLASRLTVLYGPSGVGKSSFLRAGLLHRMRHMTSSEPSDLGAPGTVVVLLDEWLDDPAAELWRLVVRAVPTSDGASPGELGERSLHDALDALSRELNVEFLILLDQFEQYLAAHPPNSGDRFGEELPGLVGDRDLPLRLLLALRDDALAGLDRFKGRIPELFDNYLRLDRLGPKAAREAIEAPIERWNSGAPEQVDLEDGLVDEVLGQLAARDVALASSAAPSDEARIEPAHLQLVMARLWAAETATSSTTLRLATLESLGGAATIVRTHVQGAMSSLPARDQRLAAQLLRYLVTPSGAKVRHVPSDLAEYVDRPEPQVRGLLERLSSGDLRILRPAPPPPGSSAPAAYEVFHDVLTGALLDWRSRFERRRLEARARRLLHALVAVSAVAIALTVYLWNPEFVRRLELDSVDARFTIRGEKAPPSDMALVAVDDATLREFNAVDGRLPRALHGRLIDRVNAGRPRAIAEDIKFEGKGPSRRGDNALIDALRRARSRIVVASPFNFTVRTTRDGGIDVEDPTMFGRERFFGQKRIKFGWPGGPSDPGKVARRIDYEITPAPEADPRAKFPTLAAKTAEVAGIDPRRLTAGAERRAVGREARRTTWIDYHGGPGTFRSVSARDVLLGRVRPNAFRDKVVVIGVIASSTNDVHPTSVEDDPIMPGPEIQANAISTMLRGAPLRDAPLIVDLLLIVALGLMPLLAWTLRSWPARLAVVLGAALAFLVGAQLLFEAGTIVAVVAPLLALALATLGILVVQGLQAWTRHRRARPAT
jgi:CHASE2 domain-containing sensor protein